MLVDVDLEAERARQAAEHRGHNAAYDEDDESHGRRGPGVQCANQ
jgi:hypothetical protein